MFFIISKIVWFLLAPSNLLALLVALGLLLASLTRARRSGLALAGIACAGLFLFGMTPLASLAMRTLEARFPVAEPLTGTVHGIVVLGGSQDPDASIALGQPVLNEAAERLVVGLELARRFPDARVLLSGGSGALAGNDTSEARAGALMLESLGLDPVRILIEERSRNTHENAVFSRDVAQPQEGETWLLVTSAFHMPRSVGVFREAGFEVVPYPVDFRTMGRDGGLPGFATISDGLRRFDVAMREYVGLVAYRLTGRTDALFPAP
ncbi:MAG: YdcF family protein [Salinarimonas sp.]